MAQQPFECTVIWCKRTFASVKEMQVHKHEDPDHFYCKRCNVDCEDWDDLIKHKVDVMAPYIEGKPVDTNLKHIVCEFCGSEFKSWGGRRRHREQLHQASQDVECPGCHIKFARASRFIGHLEFGQCKVIRPYIFADNVQRKHMQAKLLQKSEALVEEDTKKGRKISSKPTKQVTFAEHVTDGPAQSDQEEAGEGGVSLLDDAIDPKIAESLKAWPRFPDEKSADIDKHMQTLSIEATKPIVATYTDSKYPPLSQTFVKASSSGTKNRQTTSNNAAGVWATGSSSTKLFPDAKKSRQAPDRLKDQEKALVKSDKSTVLHGSRLDPSSSDYNVERFRQGVFFKCPFPNCTQLFDVSAEVAEHIIDVHTRKSYTCTSCHKRFDFAASLIAHAESAGRCRVREISSFNKLLDEITGGFLTSKSVHQPKLIRPGTSLVKSGEATDGVMDTKFKAT